MFNCVESTESSSISPHPCTTCEYLVLQWSLCFSEPTVTCHYYPKSIIDSRVHSWWCTFCEFWQMYNNDMYPPLAFVSLEKICTWKVKYHHYFKIYMKSKKIKTSKGKILWLLTTITKRRGHYLVRTNLNEPILR